MPINFVKLNYIATYFMIIMQTLVNIIANNIVFIGNIVIISSSIMKSYSVNLINLFKCKISVKLKNNRCNTP